MAGTLYVFNEFTQDLGEKVHDFSSDTIKLALIDSTVIPLVDADTPRWDATSGQDYKGHEVSAAGNYTADGVTIPVTWDRTGLTSKLDDDSTDINWLADPAGFDNARYGIIYNSDATNKNAIAFIDFETTLNEKTGPVNIYWNTSGIVTVSVI